MVQEHERFEVTTSMGFPPKKTCDQRRANCLHKSLYMYIMSICLTNFQVCEHVSEKGSETNV